MKKAKPDSVRIMVDLETMSTSPRSAIVSVGAQAFTEERLLGEHESGTFYSAVDLESCARVGLELGAPTVMFWLTQADEARAALLNGAPLRPVLEAFSAWYNARGAVELWGNGATFDNVILRSAYNAVDLRAPWSYADDRCFRTLRALVSVQMPESERGVRHHALEDARWQAKYAQQALAMIRRGVES